MWYNINYNRLAVLLLPTALRKVRIVSYLRALLVPVDSLYYLWKNFRVDNIYKVTHTGQVCSLRKSLNDRFDPELRRIYIGDGQQNPTTYMHTEAEYQELHINTEAEADTVWLYMESETADSGLDFIVYVPFGVAFNNKFALYAHIDFYKAGGKRYAIITF